jgi:hypothetical protein
LADRQLAARDFELGPDEILWSVERARDEFSNVVRGDRLVRPVLVKSTGRGEHLVDRPRDRLTHA